ncbi:TIGR00725 family protein [Thermovibrio sp.]
MSLRNVSVIGDGNVAVGSELYEAALKAGRLIGRKGLVLVCGGLFGVMEAACKGAKEAGGITVGILPHYEETANPFVDVKIPTGMGHGRNVIVAASGSVVVAVGGNYGTLSEIAFALKLGKRVIGFKTWRVEGIENYEEMGDFLSAVDRAL